MMDQCILLYPKEVNTMNMKKYIISILACVCCFVFCSCALRNDEYSQKYYHIGMFDSLSVNDSTLKDVVVIAPDLAVTITSFGAVGEIPTEDGQYVRIIFIGSELVVSSIELASTSWCGQ